MTPKDTYTALIEPFDEVHKDTRGGVTFDYATGEQVATRLNEVLTVAGWSFKVLEHGIHVEADEIWVLGEITATFDGAIVTRQQFGSQKIKRSRKDNTPLDIGFDLKGATTDAMKKCASLVGVGLYLSHKEARARADAPLPRDVAPPQQGVQNGKVARPTHETLDALLAQAKQLLTPAERDAIKTTAAQFDLPTSPSATMAPAQVRSWCALLEDALKAKSS